jgi:Protein of unknown function (DUF2510)
MESTGGPGGQGRQQGGWYSDPWRRAQYRYFDGRNWTAQVANNGITSIDDQGLLSGSQQALPAPGANDSTSPTSASIAPSGRNRHVWTIIAVVLVCAVGGLFTVRARAVRHNLETRATTTIASLTGEPLAVCRDGSQATNSDLGATCSAHGGIDRWITVYGTCVDGIVVKMDWRTDCRTHGGFGHTVKDPTTVSANDQLAANLRVKLGDELRSATTDSDHVIATIKPRVGGSERMWSAGITETLKALAESDLPSAVTTITVIVLDDAVNKFGETHEAKAVTASYTRATLDRIVFSNIDSTKILGLADAGTEFS